MNTRNGYSIDPERERGMPLIEWEEEIDDPVLYRIVFSHFDEQGFPVWEFLPEEEE